MEVSAKVKKDVLKDQTLSKHVTIHGEGKWQRLRRIQSLQDALNAKCYCVIGSYM
ncbi:putative transcription factor [Sesbania bispinosa]|nr:putative transcription factor [Sesbania bispinosa]